MVRAIETESRLTPVTATGPVDAGGEGGVSSTAPGPPVSPASGVSGVSEPGLSARRGSGTMTLLQEAMPKPKKIKTRAAKSQNRLSFMTIIIPRFLIKLNISRDILHSSFLTPVLGFL
jgi:hypothetical protein